MSTPADAAGSMTVGGVCDLSVDAVPRVGGAMAIASRRGER
jgi:hypothetical protein